MKKGSTTSREQQEQRKASPQRMHHATTNSNSPPKNRESARTSPQRQKLSPERRREKPSPFAQAQTIVAPKSNLSAEQRKKQRAELIARSTKSQALRQAKGQVSRYTHVDNATKFGKNELHKVNVRDLCEAAKLMDPTVTSKGAVIKELSVHLPDEKLRGLPTMIMLFEEFKGLGETNEPQNSHHLNNSKGITRECFTEGLHTIMELQEDMFSAHFFDVFDENGDSTIDFREFLIALGAIFKPSIDDKITMVFHIYDQEKTGCITRDKLREMFEGTIGSLSSEEQEYMADDLDQWVDETFSEIDVHHTGKLTLADVRKAVATNPRALECFGRVFVDAMEVQTPAVGAAASGGGATG